MELRTKFQRRGQEIVQCLAWHGPLSTAVLNRMLNPKMKPKKLRQALYRLRDKKVVQLRISGQPSLREVHWHVSDKFLNLPTTRATYSFDRAYLTKMRHSRRWLPSHEVSRLWIHFLSRVLPDVEIVRRDNFQYHAEASQILRLAEKPNLSLPDYLIFFSDVNDERVCVSFDFEEARASLDASVHRLKSYARHTNLDGVIYVTSADTLGETAEMIFKAAKRDSRLRKGGYWPTYFTFSNATEYFSNPLSQLFTCIAQPVVFADWYVQISAFKQAQLHACEDK